jgi:hypothetical protein
VKGLWDVTSRSFRYMKFPGVVALPNTCKDKG